MAIQPTLALIPAAQGSKFYSVLPSNGVGDFDFTRASTATRVNSKGLIEEVASGVSRLDYTGGGCPHHLLEPQSTNLITYSEDFSQWTKDRVTVSENQIISPNGYKNADLIAENSEDNVHRIYIGLIALTANVDYTITVFAKKGNSSVIQLTATSGSAIGNGRANFDLENGILGNVLGGSADIINYGNGWYRCSYTFEALASTTSAISINFVNDDLTALRNVTYTGSTNNNAYLWGAQLEQSSYASSLIPTNGSTVTRLAETANNAGDASTFNDSEGVLMAEIKLIPENTISSRISLSDGTIGNRITIEDDEVANRLRVFSSGGGLTTAMLDIQENAVSDGYFKIAIQYNGSIGKVYFNGIERGSSTGMDAKTGLNNLRFESASGSQDFYGNTKKLEYYNTALTDLELETLTSFTSFNEMALNFNYTI